jgi:hypothetical protein
MRGGAREAGKRGGVVRAGPAYVWGRRWCKHCDRCERPDAGVLPDVRAPVLPFIYCYEQIYANVIALSNIIELFQREKLLIFLYIIQSKYWNIFC